MPDVFIAKEKKAKPLGPIPPKLETHLRKDKIKAWGHELRFLSSVAFEPSRLHFEHQDSDEKIILLIRPHLITNLKWFVLVVLLGLVPLFAFGLLDFSSIPLDLRFVGLMTWYLLIFAFGFERFLVWFYNVEIVTNKRIIDVNIPNILFRDISQTPLENIQDITAETAGFMRSWLAFGDVRIQTAGSVAEIKFEAVPSPNRVSQIINDLCLRRKLDGRF